jgi:hypothetical protein
LPLLLLTLSFICRISAASLLQASTVETAGRPEDHAPDLPTKLLALVFSLQRLQASPRHWLAIKDAYARHMVLLLTGSLGPAAALSCVWTTHHTSRRVGGNHPAVSGDLARRRHSPHEASRGGRLASRKARRKNGETVGNVILVLFLYFSDAKWFKRALGVALTHLPC